MSTDYQDQHTPFVMDHGCGICNDPVVAPVHYPVSLPFTCPHCGAPFGFGPDAVLLGVVSSVAFDEPAPCCGKRVTGILGRNGEVAFDG